MHLLRFEFDMRSMKMKRDTKKQTKQTREKKIIQHRTKYHKVLAHERIAGMIMPLPYMFVASLKLKENTQNYVRTERPFKSIRSCAKKKMWKIKCTKQSNDSTSVENKNAISS